MTEKSCIRNDIPSAAWITTGEEQEWQDTSPLAESVVPFPNHSIPLYHSEYSDDKRQTVARISARLIESGLPGTDLIH